LLFGLAIGNNCVISKLQEHVNHGCDDGGRLVDVIEIRMNVIVWSVVSLDVLGVEPFSYNQEVHPTEESKHHQNLRNELEQEVKSVAEVEGVETLHYDTKGHLNYCEDNCCLHLEVVGVGQELITKAPFGIKTEGISAVS
jgi:hypothetical protein